MSGSLKVLLADTDPDRAAALGRRLGEISDAVILRVPAGGSLIDTVAALAPDVIIVDMTRPDRDGLDDLRRVSADNPRLYLEYAIRSALWMEFCLDSCW